MSRTDLANPARPAAGTILCPLDEIASPGARGFRFRVEDAVFAGFVVRRGQAVVGYVDSCPHAGWPLAGPNGRFLTRENDLILCAGHAALFRIEDGAMVAGPCQDVALTPWPVRIEGSDIVVV
ncbi:Rieske (2Fe-2S) protein [Caulobacter sp. UNC279MFTsu5.1]|uniref:Rieske (2Fe-2S) protein n=1 Tax=Caulobacter sp. UNC279MFTsu5.1 TaxID=1502775 RepID=UPI0008E9BF4E|nr:Rieske (2Fe-2S) protein [Caulobacter sp. UNC279MFTsu5.1]SFJ92751.1 Ferredoxin subunit of nitrite reductase or a ring-hydroxylating dioxygenase [Caulobacter sp. UNC279MFTsu5.1]